MTRTKKHWIVSASCLITVLLGAGATLDAQAGTFDLIDWNSGKFIYGVDYYPEAWAESQWEKDAAMMESAGINFARLAEFAWVKIELEEGHYDFAWLDRARQI